MNISAKQKALDKIAAKIAVCRICKIDKIGKAVPGEGSPNAKIVFIGEAPGKTEAKTGRPFVGPAGKILRKLIANVGLDESKVYITSPVKYLPKHVTPTPAEIKHGSKHLEAQLKIIKPKIIVLLGNTAAKALVSRPVSIGLEHGKIIEDKGKRYFLSYHPAAPLHNPNLRKDLTADFRKLRKFIS